MKQQQQQLQRQPRDPPSHACTHNSRPLAPSAIVEFQCPVCRWCCRCLLVLSLLLLLLFLVVARVLDCFRSWKWNNISHTLTHTHTCAQGTHKSRPQCAPHTHTHSGQKRVLFYERDYQCYCYDWNLMAPTASGSACRQPECQSGW